MVAPKPAAKGRQCTVYRAVLVNMLAPPGADVTSRAAPFGRAPCRRHTSPSVSSRPGRQLSSIHGPVMAAETLPSELLARLCHHDVPARAKCIVRPLPHPLGGWADLRVRNRPHGPRRFYFYACPCPPVYGPIRPTGNITCRLRTSNQDRARRPAPNSGQPQEYPDPQMVRCAEPLNSGCRRASMRRR